MPVFTVPSSNGEPEGQLREGWSDAARRAARIARKLNPKTRWDQITPNQRELLKIAFKQFYAGGDKNFKKTKLSRALRYSSLTGTRIKRLFSYVR